MTRKVQAVMDKIVVEVLKAEQITEAGIIIPEDVITTPQNYGKVISIGADVKEITEGDTIMFFTSGGMDIMHDGIVLKVLAYGEIYAIIKGE